MPREVTILGLKYKVELVEVVSKYLPRIGEINYIEQVIRIDSTLSEERKQQTLLHEILHGICEQLGLDEINNDEKAISAISIALHQVMTELSFDFGGQKR